MNNLYNALTGITSPTYNNTIQHVYMYNTSIDKVKEYPSIIIAGNTESKQFGPVDYYTCKLRVYLDAAVIEGDRTEKTSKALSLLEDIEKCVMSDYTRGGYATDTKVVNSFIVMLGDSESRKVGVRVVLDVDYRHKVSDPASL
jgi:hypothetical protein